MPNRNRCVVGQCRDLYKWSNDKEHGVTVFGVPKHSLEKWQEFIPNLTKSSEVCSRHFEQTDIVIGVEIKGEFHHYKKWRLKPGSLPKLNLGPSGRSSSSNSSNSSHSQPHTPSKDSGTARSFRVHTVCRHLCLLFQMLQLPKPCFQSDSTILTMA